MRSLTNGRVLSRGTEEGVAGEPATMGEASTAFVRDTAVFGPTGPVLGDRLRFEVASNFGELSVTRVLLDHRRTSCRSSLTRWRRASCTSVSTVRCT